jgi:hypothetical protein
VIALFSLPAIKISKQKNIEGPAMKPSLTQSGAFAKSVASRDDIAKLAEEGKALVLVRLMGGAHDVADASRGLGTGLQVKDIFAMKNTPEAAKRVIEAVGGLNGAEAEVRAANVHYAPPKRALAGPAAPGMASAAE